MVDFLLFLLYTVLVGFFAQAKAEGFIEPSKQESPAGKDSSAHGFTPAI